MKYTYTLLLTIIGAALCLMHMIGHDSDPVYMIFYSLSVPAWIYSLYTYTHINQALLYVTTILSWTLIGYVIDSLLWRKKVRH
ncbi:hypothetical protein SAMN03159341_11327 [Paenibacillus sp. 1_12]|uniref:hypothetical protein n=1 Tax=Paenibacillus sp. 1_12 TaxID=1566278 RepID=UPI0008E94CC3|nr:hypothetical protein [Paenibacillus sp. 1_12]SFL97477.1 hypothetical protein SAMN03159341_11327 [Paenibacillus sp. 1_12]